MSTLVVYSDTTDWGVDSIDDSEGGNYPAARDGYGLATSGYANSLAFYVGQSIPYEYLVQETFISFDTSSIGSDSVSAAVLNMTSSADYSTTDFTIQARLYDWGTGVTTADWRSYSQLAALTLLATKDTASGFTAGTAYDFADSAMAANVNKTGSTRMVLCSNRHVAGTAPTDSQRVAIRSADETGTTSDPKLTVTYAAGSTEVYDGPGPTLDAWIIATRTGSFTAAAILKRTQVGSFTADAAIKSTVAGSFTTNAVLLRGQTGSFAANAITLKAASSSFTAAATIKATVADSTKADAIRLRTFWFGRVEDGF